MTTERWLDRPDVDARHHGPTRPWGERPRLSDDCLGAARSTLVRACLDILPVIAQSETFVLGHRKYPPRQDWWIFGGGWPFAWRARDALVVAAERELGLTISQERFIELPPRSLVWTERREPPAANGAHDISHPFALLLAEAEWRTLRAFHDQHEHPEYFQVRQWSYDDIVDRFEASDPLRSLIDSFRFGQA